MSWKPEYTYLPKYRVSQKNVPHLNLEYLKNYARDVHDVGVIRKRVLWKLLCYDEDIPCHEATRY